MHGNKTDKRSVRTRAAIESALLELLKDHALDCITIKNVCETAQVNRTTFYLHYTSTLDVLENIREEFINHILENYGLYAAKPGIDAYTAFLKAINESTFLTPTLENFILNSKEAGVFIHSLKASFYEKLYGAVIKEAREDRKEHCAYVTAFLCSGVIDAYILWLKKGKSTPFNILCDSFSLLIKTGHSYFMRDDSDKDYL